MGFKHKWIGLMVLGLVACSDDGEKKSEDAIVCDESADCGSQQVCILSTSECIVPECVTDAGCGTDQKCDLEAYECFLACDEGEYEYVHTYVSDSESDPSGTYEKKCVAHPAECDAANFSEDYERCLCLSDFAGNFSPEECSCSSDFSAVSCQESG